MTVSDRDAARLRVSDADRDAAVGVLRDHMAAGRLTLDEFNERVGEAYSARTQAALQHALRELPGELSLTSPAPARPPTVWRGRASFALTRFTIVNGVCLSVWAASGHGYFWPMWVLIPTGLILTRRLFGDERHRHRLPYPEETAPGAPEPRSPGEPEHGRVVMSVLFVDIVDSTKRATAVGDAAWQRLIDEFEAQVGVDARNHSGETLFTKGDEIVAGFTSPAAAVECGMAVREHLTKLGIDVRLGIHAGEVDRRGNRAAGLAMHIGRRICEAAAPQQVLTSSTIRDLLAGSTIRFTPVGDYELKGLEGTWRLYEPAPVVA